MKELIQELNNLNIVQTSCDWEENIPEEIYLKFFENKSTEVCNELDVGKHRWYETSTTVIAVNNGFLGINLVTDVFSENMDISDCGEEISFFEMEEFTTTSYRVKSK
jgi:hypothetical protein